MPPQDPKDPAPNPTPATPPAPTPAPAPAAPAQPAAPKEDKPIDIKSILLPKKEAPGATVDSAQRVNAGALFAQEQQATLAPQPTPPAAAPQPAAAPAPAPIVVEEKVVRPLQTYKSDIESLVAQGGVSEVAIAAAEAARKDKDRGKMEEQKPPKPPFAWKKWAFVAGGVVLAVGGTVLVAGALLRPTTVPVEQRDAHTAIIYVDDARVVAVAPPRHEAMSALVAARDQSNLAIGLLERLYITRAPTQENPTIYPIQDLLTLFAANIPVELLRTLKPEYLLGIHSYDSNQPFLLLRPDSYDVAYSGMLRWEVSMRADLAPLFNRKPPVRINTDTVPAPAPVAPLATTTASTTPAATSSPAEAVPEPEPVTAIINTGFVDKIIENRDTRALLAPDGELLLLWTFIDRGTLLIATNETTLREVVARMAQAHIITLPQ